MTMAVILAIDFGTRRLGLAVSDPAGLIAFPLPALTRKGTVQDVASLMEVIRNREVTQVILGMPLTLRGDEQDAADRVRAFAAALQEASGIVPAFMDERLSSAEANRRMLEADVSRSRRRQAVDSMAAAIILERYLAEQSR